MSLTNIVAQNLRAVRGEQKLSQQVLAKKAEVSVSYISMLERGERTPSLETLGSSRGRSACRRRPSPLPSRGV